MNHPAIAPLQLDEACFRTVVDESPNAGVISDFTGRIVYVNKSFVELFIEADCDPIGRNLSDLLPDELTSALDALSRQVIEGGLKVEREATITRSDGSRRLVRSTKFPVVDPAGNAIGVIQLITDITSEREIERQLRQAQKLDAVGQLTGGIAHDFNNLLMVIDGYARQAKHRLDDREAADSALQEVITGAERAANLTRQLLTFSRRQLMEKRVFSVTDALRDLRGLLARSVGELYDLSIDLSTPALAAETDPSEFAQAVINLAVNARDAMEGGGAIRIGSSMVISDAAFRAAHPGLSASRYARVYVSDEGHGMDRETMNRVFEPFFTTKEQGKGTGLGLAMVYGFARQSGGAVDIESAPGEGTTVSILLPIANRLPDAASDEIAASWRGKGETILLVEDDPKVRGLIRHSLEDIGYQVLTADNGFNALECDQSHDGRIDLVLSDVVMPVMGGLELADLLRRRRPDLKFVFMSGYPKREDGIPTDLPRDTTFLQKPLRMSRLAQAIRDALDSKGLRLAT